MLGNTRDDMSVPGNVFDCQHARRDSDELHKWFKKFGDIIGYSEKRNWEKWKRRTIAVNTFILFVGKSKTKSLDGGKRPMFMTAHAVDIGTCNSRHDNSELSLLGDASEKIPWPYEIPKLNSEFPSRSFRQGSEQKRKGQKLSYTDRKTGECFQRKTIGFCSKSRHMQFSTHTCHGTPWDCGKKWETQRDLT